MKSIVNTNGILNINVAQFNNGLYLYKLVGSNGNKIGEGKISIIHIK
jgi:hypothetical protein